MTKMFPVRSDGRLKLSVDPALPHIEVLARRLDPASRQVIMVRVPAIKNWKNVEGPVAMTDELSAYLRDRFGSFLAGDVERGGWPSVLRALIESRNHPIFNFLPRFSNHAITLQGKLNSASLPVVVVHSSAIQAEIVGWSAQLWLKKHK